ncbi:MAG: hypothetical protein A3G34_17280 [Candidatus Lindowbacteria bacterium RIFCSPLOWO2_12_FULL_62_27]|nr:MAG: hypothetical protein A3G34_17280 [Candidatus Lindowbacteria bacterium RIFCSPLOWO2_12_FULL_62_27]
MPGSGCAPIPLLLAACFALFTLHFSLCPAQAAPYHPKIIAEMRARGETVPVLCPDRVGHLWSKISKRTLSAPAGGGGRMAPNRTPAPTGNLKVAAFIVQFQADNDAVTSGSGQFAPDLLGDTNSVGDTIRIILSRADNYYRMVSYNQLQMSSTVFDTLMVTASETMGYYATGMRQADLIREVCERVDTWVNFGYYDFVAVFYAGMSKQVSGLGGDLSASMFDGLNDSYTDRQTQDTVTLAIMMPGTAGPGPFGPYDRVAPMGTFCHEMGHVLGLADIYNTVTQSAGVSDWSLMASGNYIGRPEGDSPAMIDPWHRELLGWLGAVVVSADTAVDLSRSETDSKVCKIYANAGNETEYFLIEYRAPSSPYGIDSAPGSGLLIWHIDNSMGTLAMNNINNVSSAVPHRRVDLVEADSSDVDVTAATAANPWPGTGNKTRFDATSSPNSQPYTGNPARVEIDNITLVGGRALFTAFIRDTRAQTWYVNDTWVNGATDSFTYASGSDTTGVGSPSAPFRTIIRALNKAKSGDTLHVDAGMYDSYVKVSSTENAGIKIDTNNLTIIGKDSAATVIDPPGANTDANLYGIYADTQVGLRIQNLGVTGAYDGIKFVNVDQSTLTGVSASSNGGHGIHLLNGSDTCTLSHNTAGSNSLDGIHLTASSKNAVSHNTARSNTMTGIYLSSSDTNVITQNEVTFNDTGVGIFAASRNNIITKNNIIGNNAYHVWNAGGLIQTLTRNWFGSTDSVTIKARVGDTASAWQPFRLGTVDTTAGADTTAPKAPDTVAIVGQGASDTSIILEWSNVTTLEEANGGNVTLAGYRVYRSTVKDTSWWMQVGQVGSGAIRYQDTAVLQWQPYYYRVTAFDAASPFANESFYSDSQPSDAAQNSSQKTWFVNDTAASADSFTYAGGTDTAYGDGSRSKPFRSVARVMQSAKSGDVIYIDAGLYADTYVTVSSTETAAFKIDTDGITIIGKDSNATVIDPPGANTQSGLYGIYADTQVNLLVKNIGVTGAYDGIHFDNVDLSTILGDSASSCGGIGIHLLDGSDTNAVTNNTAHSNFWGVILNRSSNNTVSNNIAHSNSVGVMVESNSNNNTVTNNAAGSNAQAGVYISSSDSTAVVQNDIQSNDTGVWIAGSSGANVIRRNNITGNAVNNVYNQGGLTQTITRNWFGSIDSVTIKAKFADTASAFSPYRTGGVDTASGADIVAPEAPDTVAILGRPSDTLVVLEWSAVTANEDGNAGGAGLSGYRVYRSKVKDTSSWVQVAQVGSGVIRHQDTNVSLLTDNYFYRVTAIDGALPFVNESFYSDSQPSYDSAAAQPVVNWYVNDTTTSGDSFTYAAGSDLMGDGTIQRPFLSPSKAMSVATAGDTIWLDSGVYTTRVASTASESAVINITADSISLIGKDSSSTILNPPGLYSDFNQYGIYADNRVNLLIRNLAVYNAYRGVKFINVDRSTLKAATVSGCQYGILLSSGSDTNSISASVFTYMGQSGIALSGSSGNTIDNNYFSNNTYGASLTASSGNTISNNTLNVQSGEAVGLASGSDTNTIGSNTITSGGTAISLGTVSGNTVTANTISGATSGLQLSIAKGNWILGNAVTSSYNYAVDIYNGADSNIFRNNLLASTTNYYGVNIGYGSYNVFVQNTIRDNRDYQVYVAYSSVSNTFEKNNIKPSSTYPDRAVYNAPTSSPGPFTFDRNYWYTTDSLTIRNRIFQNVNADSVLYTPWRLAEVDTTAGADTTAPRAPDTVAVVGNDTSVILEWAAVSTNEETTGGAVGVGLYRIYRSAVADTSSWNKVGQVSAATGIRRFQDTGAGPGTDYYYCVTAVDTAPYENESFYSYSVRQWQLTSYRLIPPDTVAAGVSFALRIVARGQFGETYMVAVNPVILSIDSGAVTPSASASFVSGVSQCTVSITVGGYRLLTLTDSGGRTASVYLNSPAMWAGSGGTQFSISFSVPGSRDSSGISVSLKNASDSATALSQDTTGATGIMSLGNGLDGDYRIEIKAPGALTRRVSVTIANGVINGGAGITIPSLVKGDANGSGDIGPGDWSVVVDNWGSTDPTADSNNSGDVGPGDWSVIVDNWGQTEDGW